MKDSGAHSKKSASANTNNDATIKVKYPRFR